jgi:EAL domain-containing protein (putative c-di-GMP-specific phosphodiesterase class I)
MEELTPHKTWYLEGFVDRSRRVWRTALYGFPFRVGRSPMSQLHLNSRAVSYDHARFSQSGGALFLADLDSTNGTFVNGRRVREAQRLEDGDEIRFADWEFGLVAVEDSLFHAGTTEKLVDVQLQSQTAADWVRRFQTMIRDRTLWAVFQPIVRLADREVIGYEALGRGRLNGHETSVEELFAIAEDLGRAAELSELFRGEQLREALALPGDPEIFLNTHPAELGSERTIVDSLERFRDDNGSLPRLCIEITEAAVTDLAVLGGLSSRLSSFDAAVAFDDFGTGQPRLLELAEISPRYVKFDRSWIRGLAAASSRRHELMTTLILMVQGLGITPIAEGVETVEEAEACADLGFELAQGFFLGRPDRAATF